MTERREKHPSFTHIYNVVAGKDPELRDVLQQAEDFLRIVSAESSRSREERKTIEEPPILEHEIFNRRYPTLKESTPLAALRKAIEAEKNWTPRASEQPLQEVASSDTASQSATETADETESHIDFLMEEIFDADREIAPETSPQETPTKNRKKRKLPKKNIPEKQPFVLPPGYVYIEDLCERFPDVSKSRIRQLVQEVGSISGERRKKAYRDTEARGVIITWLEDRLAQKEAETIQQPEIERISYQELKAASGLSHTLLKDLLADVPFQRRKGYDKVAALARLRNVPPRVNTPDGEYRDDNEVLWRSPDKLARRLGLSFRVVKELIADVTPREVVGKNNRIRSVYNSNEVVYLNSIRKEKAKQKHRTVVPRFYVLFSHKDEPDRPVKKRKTKKGQQKIHFSFPEKPESSIKKRGIKKYQQKIRFSSIEKPHVPRGYVKDSSSEELLFTDPKFLTVEEVQAKMKEPIRFTKKLDPEIWESEKSLAKRWGISQNAVTKVLTDEMKGVRGNQRYYKIETADEKIAQYVALKPDNSGVVAREGRLWAPIFYFNKRFGISYPTLRTNLDKVSTLTGAGGVMLYAVDQSVLVLDSFISAPYVDKETGVYTDDEEKQWAPATIISSLLGISNDKLQTYLPEVATMDVRSRGKRLVQAYDLAEIRKRTANYVTLPEIGEGNDPLVDVQSLSESYNLSAYTIKKLLTPIATSTRGRNDIGYRKSAAEEILESFTKRPEIVGEKNEYVDETGDVYVVRGEAAKRLGVHYPAINRAIEEGGIAKIEARKGGQPLELYRLTDLQDYQSRPRIRRTPAVPVKRGPTVHKRPGFTYWAELPEDERVALIESKAREIISQGKTLDATTLRMGDTGLKKAIENYYPGGIRALRANVDSSGTSSGNRDWKNEKNLVSILQAEGIKILEDNEGEFNQKILQKAGLWGPINDYYPGGYVQFRDDFGLEQPPIRWSEYTPEERTAMIEDEAKELVYLGIKFTGKNLTAEGQRFKRVITRYYPGGSAALHEKLGIADIPDAPKKTRNWSKERNPKQAIQQAIRTWMKENKVKDFTTMDLPSGLVSAIYNYYPGSYDRLRQDLRLLPRVSPSGYWTTERIQAKVKEIIEKKGKFTTGIAQELGEDALLTAIKNNYEGGVSQVLTDLGQELNRKEWSESMMEEAALEILREHGKLTSDLLKAVPGLKTAVFRRYPGNLSGLKERLKQLEEQTVDK